MTNNSITKGQDCRDHVRPCNKNINNVATCATLIKDQNPRKALNQENHIPHVPLAETDQMTKVKRKRVSIYLIVLNIKH